MASQANKNSMSTRRENRARAPLSASMVRGGGIAQPVTIRDMSSGGLQATCFNLPNVGEKVTIRFENDRSVHGVVKWSVKGVFGLEFRFPINVAMITENLDNHPLRRSTDRY